MSSAQPLRIAMYREPWMRTLYLVVAIGFFIQAASLALSAIGIDIYQPGHSAVAMSESSPYNTLLWAAAFLGFGITFLFRYRIELIQGPLKRYRKALRTISLSQLEETLKLERELNELERIEVREAMTERRPGWSQSADRA